MQSWEYSLNGVRHPMLIKAQPVQTYKPIAYNFNPICNSKWDFLIITGHFF